MTAEETSCPFVGLDPYSEKDREYFFGREREQRIVTANLTASPLTIFHGASGVGKSSVLLAGVVPRLRDSPRRVVVVYRDWQRSDSYAELRRACAAAAPSGGLDPALPLDKIVEALVAQTGARVCLLLDQFEEYLLTSSPATAADFEAALARTVNRDDLDAAVLVSLRDDALALLDRLRGRIANLFANTIRLHHLEAAEARVAIDKALAQYSKRHREGRGSVTAEKELVDEVIRDVRPGRLRLTGSSDAHTVTHVDNVDRVEGPFLQLVMTRLFREDAVTGTLRLATLNRLGGAEAIVADHFDSVMKTLTPKQREACARFFDRLVTPSGSKIAITEQDLVQFAESAGGEVPAALKRLTEARIIRHVAPASDRPMAPRCEVFHDVLGPALLDWRRHYLEHVRIVTWVRRMLVSAAVSLAVAAPLGYAWLQRSEARAAEFKALRAEESASRIVGEPRHRLLDGATADYLNAGAAYHRGFDRRDSERVQAAAVRLDPWGYLIDAKRGVLHPLRGDVVRIGRDIPDQHIRNDIPFEGPNRTISRHHLEIRKEGLDVEDLRSTVGTSIDGEWIQYGSGRRLADGNVIVLGGSEVLQFRKKSPAAPVALPLSTWAILVDGYGKQWQALVAPEYSLHVTPRGLEARDGTAAGGIARIRRGDGGALLEPSGEWECRLGINYAERLEVLVQNFGRLLGKDSAQELFDMTRRFGTMAEQGVPFEREIDPEGMTLWAGRDGDPARRFVIVRVESPVSLGAGANDEPH